MLKLIFFALFLFTCSLSAKPTDETMSRADLMLKSKNKTEIFRAYNEYKNIYLRAIMNSDTKLKKRSLNGIIDAGEKLHIDVKRYKKELKKSNANSKKTAQSSSKSSKTSKKETTKNKKIKISKNKRLLSASWSGSTLVLKFSSALSSKDVNYFKIINSSKKRYRYIFDINSALGNIKTLKHKEITKIRLAQFKPKVSRMVIENSKSLKINYEIDGKTLTIDLHVKAVKAPKAIPQKKKVTKTKPIAYSKAYSKYTIVIDPGHGGRDSGAVGYKRYQEKKIVLAIGLKLRNKLKKLGFKVYMTRSKDKYIKLKKRTKYANNKNADMFISIHANSIPKTSNVNKAYGVETYFLSPSRSSRADRVAATENRAEIEDMSSFAKNNFLHFLNREKIIASNKLSIDLQQSMLSSLRSKYDNVRDGGVREGPFWILVGAQMPAVLVEVGFISNPREAKRLINKKYQGYIANGLADGVVRYFMKNQ
ncbi:MAG: N-acetylmuramoyl-L-alanine amidase [Campylobacterota bacterium]|nr:N-acetylmuramoyl-L-alanine amidase [Campylobacterota bacterium]